MLLDLVLEGGVLLREPLDLSVELVELAVELVEVIVLLLTHFVHLHSKLFIDLLELGQLLLQVIALALSLVFGGQEFGLLLVKLLQFALGL